MMDLAAWRKQRLAELAEKRKPKAPDPIRALIARFERLEAKVADHERRIKKLEAQIKQGEVER